MHSLGRCRESLDKVDARDQRPGEGARAALMKLLTTQVHAMADSQNHLRSETGNLVRALRAPSVRVALGGNSTPPRGRTRWHGGAIAILSSNPAIQTEEGRLRPDLIVHPPGGKTIVVDAKTPLSAYLEALDATDDESRGRLLDQPLPLQVRVSAY